MTSLKMPEDREIGTLTAQSSGATTTLTGEIETTDIEVGSKLCLSFTGSKNDGGSVDDEGRQDGTL